MYCSAHAAIMTHLCKRLAFSVYPILNIAAYRFVDIAEASELRASLHSKTDALALKGTILVAPEGLNLALAGAPESVRAFFDDLQRDARFAGLTLKESWSAEVPFARLKVKLKREIIAFRRDGVDPLKAPAPSVAPPTLARWLAQGHDDEGKRVVMLDTRNREEVALGTFDGALCLPITQFVQLPEALEPQREALANATVVSFCTGGIRCEKAAPWLRAKGFGDVRQLEGGILAYFDQVGAAGYTGGCFVFDERLALGPTLLPVTP